MTAPVKRIRGPYRVVDHKRTSYGRPASPTVTGLGDRHGFPLWADAARWARDANRTWMAGYRAGRKARKP